MKVFKKLAALLLAGAMATTMSVATFAAYDVTINQNEDDKGTHTYGAYQIFAGDLSADGKTLSNIKWGSGISAEGQSALGDAAEYAKGMTDSNAAEKAAQLANYLTSPEKQGSDKIEGLKGGYYLIQDDTDPTGNPSSKTKFILNVITTKSVTVKSSVPSVEKKVKDVNDSTGDVSDWQDTADYEIGDSIPYQVTATIGSGIGNYESYSVQFVDTMTHLTLDKDVAWKVMVGDEDITSEFVLTNTDKTYTWSAKDIKPYIQNGSKVVLTYNAKLDADAVYGVEGNPNTVLLKYDNNPNSSGEGKPQGTTPEDTNIVFTYKPIVNKVDENSDPLNGAAFTLYKEVKEGTETGEAIKATLKSQNASIKAEALEDEKYYEALEMTPDQKGTTFTYKSVDDGTYVLVETTIPDGYNAYEAQKFVVEATHTQDPQPALTELKGGDVLKGNTTSGELVGDVKNLKGSTLPSTGGMGTTIFYVIGAILVLAAAIVLIARRKVQR